MDARWNRYAGWGRVWVLASALALLTLATPTETRAEIKTWDSGGGAWNTGAKWSGGTVPVNGDTVWIGLTATPSEEVLFDQAITVAINQLELNKDPSTSSRLVVTQPGFSATGFVDICEGSSTTGTALEIDGVPVTMSAGFRMSLGASSNCTVLLKNGAVVDGITDLILGGEVAPMGQATLSIDATSRMAAKNLFVRGDSDRTISLAPVGVAGGVSLSHLIRVGDVTNQSMATPSTDRARPPSLWPRTSGWGSAPTRPWR